MKQQAFRGATMKEALTRVKAHLGTDAEILGTRVLKLGREADEVEVTARLAGRSGSPAAPPPDAPSTPAPLGQPLAPTASAVRLDRELARITRTVEGFGEVLDQITRFSERYALGILAEPERDLYRLLTQRGLVPSLVLDLLAKVRAEASGPLANDPERLRAAVRKAVSARIRACEPRQPGLRRRVVLVGPAGAGKTTATAKIASGALLAGDRAVQLATADLFRVGAAWELKTYGRLLGAPVRVLREGAELAAILASRDPGLIVVDTSGRAPEDPRQRDLLASLLRHRAACEIHLTLSATMKPEDQTEAWRRFSWTGADRILLTHLDESSTPGSLLQVLEATGLPVSYLSTGASVPGALEEARSDRLADWVLGPEIGRQ